MLMSPDLPAPVRRYFEAEQSNDTSRMANFFAADAVVIDEKKTHSGLEAIQAWKEEAKATTSYQVTPLRAQPEGDRLVVTGNVEGDFPGSPVELRYFFTLTGDRISALEIRL
jgi:ketosteroid isomerase-like protein